MSKSINKGFSRYERNGIILLCILIIISIVSKKYVVSYYSKKSTPLTSIDKNKLAQLQHQISEAKITYSNNNKTKEYNTKDDSKNYTASNATYTKKDYYNFTIEVNSATAEDFEKLYGIGKVYAARIVTFRDKLGGFYSVDQLKDVWGIEDSTYQKFKKNLTIKPAKIQKLNINTATFEELTANPYFFSTVAKQIIGYRSKVKPFATVDDIKNLYYVRDHPEQFNKMAPYVVIN
jgi:competence ComEA-like helix-hairpin-helix protein